MLSLGEWRYKTPIGLHLHNARLTQWALNFASLKHRYCIRSLLHLTIKRLSHTSFLPSKYSTTWHHHDIRFYLNTLHDPFRWKAWSYRCLKWVLLVKKKWNWSKRYEGKTLSSIIVVKQDCMHKSQERPSPQCDSICELTMKILSHALLEIDCANHWVSEGTRPQLAYTCTMPG